MLSTAQTRRITSPLCSFCSLPTVLTSSAAGRPPEHSQLCYRASTRRLEYLRGAFHLQYVPCLIAHTSKPIRN